MRCLKIRIRRLVEESMDTRDRLLGQLVQRILDTVELTGNQWLIRIAGGSVIVVASEIRRALLRRRPALPRDAAAGA